MKTLLLSLLFLITVIAARGDLLIPPPPYLDIYAQDGDGTIWAGSKGRSGSLYTFDGVLWRESPCPFPEKEKAIPHALVPMLNGGVACLWRINDTSLAVTRHQKNNAEVTGQFEASISRDSRNAPFRDSQGRIWLTSDSPHIVCIAPDGKSISSLTLPEKFYRKPKRRPDGFNHIKATEDARGRIWLWSRTHYSNYTTFEGIYLLEGENWRHLPAISGVEKLKLSALVSKNESHLWAATCKGLFEVNIETLEATPQPEPEPGAFTQILELFEHQRTWYAVSIPSRSNIRAAVLWRQHGKTKKWQKVIAEFDSPSASHFPAWFRHTHRGYLILSSQNGGPWVVLSKAKGQATRLTWRNRFPLEQITFITSLRAPGNPIFMGGRGGAYVGPLPLPAPVYDNPRITEFPHPHAWAPSPEGHFWAIRRDLAPAGKAPWPLLEWNGTAWVEHALPEKESTKDYSTLLVDHKNRIWLHGHGEKRPSFVYHPNERRWESFPDAQSAYLAYRSDPPEWYALKPHRADRVARYSRDGKQFAFVRNSTLHYFNGTEWQSWPRKEIAGKHGGIQQAPYFDNEGSLYAQFNNDAWRLDEDGQWESTPLEESRKIDNNSPPVPDWFPRLAPEQRAAVDNTGTYWIISNKKLYRARNGEWVEVFKEGESNPFLVKSSLFDAWQDKAGNVFLNAAGGISSFLQIASQHAAPTPELHASVHDEDAVTLTLKGEEIDRWQWRLDDGPWEPATARKVTLVGVSNGHHTMQARAINAELVERDAEAKFSIEIAPAAQLAKLIAALHSADYDLRKQAVGSLSRQPPIEARVALRKALQETSDSDRRWWLTAALQEVERTMQQKEK